MDIKLPLPIINKSALPPPPDKALALKVGAQLDLKVLMVNRDMTTVTLQMKGQNLKLQLEAPLPLQKGQTLQLIVTQVKPVIQFKVAPSPENSTSQPLVTKPLSTATATLIKLEPTQPPINKEVPLQNRLEFLPKEQIQAKVTAVTEQKAQVHIEFAQQTKNDSIKQIFNLPIDKKLAPVLKEGQTLTLEVTKPGWNPQFKIVAIAAPDQPQAAKVDDFIKQFLPKQESPTELINKILEKAPEHFSKGSAEGQLQQIARQIIEQLPLPKELVQSESIKKIIQQTGIFLEAKLSAAPEQKETDLKTDLKNSLLKFLDVLKAELSVANKPDSRTDQLDFLNSLLQKTEHALAKITLDQLSSLPKEDTNKQVWHLEIPFLQDSKSESLTVDIERNRYQEGDKSNDSWMVDISLTPPNIGKLQCKLLFLDKKVNVYFQSEQKGISQLIEQHLDHLQQQLTNAGLTPGNLNSSQTFPAKHSVKATRQSNFLDEEA